MNSVVSIHPPKGEIDHFCAILETDLINLYGVGETKEEAKKNLKAQIEELRDELETWAMETDDL